MIQCAPRPACRSGFGSRGSAECWDDVVECGSNRWWGGARNGRAGEAAQRLKGGDSTCAGGTDVTASRGAHLRRRSGLACLQRRFHATSSSASPHRHHWHPRIDACCP
eukprot:1939980-Prymnesium_polylepis.1